MLKVFARKKVVETRRGPQARDRARRGAEAQRRSGARGRDRDRAADPGVRPHRRADGQAGHPAARAGRRARRGLLGLHRQAGQDHPRHGAPDREAQRDRGPRQGRGGDHRARADPGGALQPQRSRPRLRPGGQEDRQGAANPALARRRGLPRPSLRGRDPRDRGGHRAGQGRRARARGARQGRRHVHEARRRSHRRLRGAPRHADPGHQPRAARARRSTSSSGRRTRRPSWRGRCPRPRSRR